MGPQTTLWGFQWDVGGWMRACFGGVASAFTAKERGHRFLEEALELAQATECTAEEAHQLVDYVFGRPIGDQEQEVGGVMITLAGLCEVAGICLEAAADAELASVRKKMDKIRAKHATKPKLSALPGSGEG